MKREITTLTLSIAVAVCAVALLLVGLGGHLPRALAHTVTVDAGAGDWTMDPPPQENLGHIGRNGLEEGEYIWNDVAGDERTDFTNPNPDPRVDLDEFRVTADATHLYFLAVMSDINQTTGNGAPMVQIAVDTDRQSGSGEAYFAGFADTQVYTDARWEYLLTTRFGNANNDLRVYTATASGSTWNPTYTGTAAISDTAETIEMAVPWSALGFSDPPTLPLRFTVAVFRADASDNTEDISGASDALDCITNYGDPGDTTSNTWAEVSDGMVDYYFDLFFESDGDVYPPLFISEVYYDTPGTETNEEWVEIYNRSPITVSLDGFKVGDEESPGGGEGMAQFPTGYEIGPGEAIVVAQKTSGFAALFGFNPDFEFVADETNVPDMSGYSPWCSSSVPAFANSGDEVLLLDPSDTAVDVVTYAGNTWPGVTQASAASEGESIERRPVYQDTNDCSVDFRTQSDPTPGQVDPDMEIHKTGPALAMPGTLVTYTIIYSNIGVDDASGVVISDTLPDDTTYLTDTSGFSCLACTPGATGVLTWAVGIVTPTDNLSFTLTALVSNTVPFGSVLTNTVEITTTDSEVTTTNNSDYWTSDVSMLDLMVDKTGPVYGVIGEPVTYAITVTNQGVTDALGVVLTDTLPVSTTFVTQTNTCGASCPACTPGATGVFTWDIGTVVSNTSCIVDLTVAISPTVPGGTVLTNTVEAGTSTTGDNPANNTALWETTVYPMMSIHDVQYVSDPATDDASPYDNEVVWVEGVVVAGTGEIGYSGNNFVIEHPTGGAWNGLMVYNGGTFPNVAEGDYVRLLGKVAEYNGMTELNIRYAPHALQVISTGNALPTPAVITTGAFINPSTAEQWEAVLIEFQGASVTNPNLGYGEWAFDDGTGATRADDFGGNDGDLTYTPSSGDYYGFIRGIGWYSYGNYKLEPRYNVDINLDYPVTFVYHDLEDVVHAGESVYLAGDFNSWNTTALSMTPNADYSVFTVTYTFDTTGTHQYKYIVYTGTVGVNPQWDWLNTTNRTMTVTHAFQQEDDYRNVDVGWAKLQWPLALEIELSRATDNVYGRVYIQNVTNPPGEGRGIVAQVGYGTDPDPANWTWFPMTYNTDDGNNDEFMGVTTPTAVGVYSYAVRFDGNWGTGNPNAGWTYGDLDGVDPGDPFELDETGVLTVTAPNLSGSKEVTPTADVRPGDLLTYTIHLTNGAGSTVTTATVTLTDVLPAGVEVITTTLPAGMTYVSSTHTLHWSGDLRPGEAVALTFRVQVLPVGLLPPGVHTIVNDVEADDGYGTVLNFSSPSVTVASHRTYLPLVVRGWGP